MDDVFGVGKAVEKLIDPVTELIKKIAGPAAEEVGLSIQDSIKVYRAKRQYQLFEKMRRFVSDAGYDPGRIPLKVLLPSLEYASVEEDEDLHTMWAALLANAANPNYDAVPAYFPDILRQLSPSDAALLRQLTDGSHTISAFRFREALWSLCGDPDERSDFTYADILKTWWNLRGTGESLGESNNPMVDEAEAQLVSGAEAFLVSLDNLLRLGLIELNEKLKIPMPTYEHISQDSFLQFNSRQCFRVTPLGHRFVRMCTTRSNRHPNQQ